MAWRGTKINWRAEDGPLADDFNRIEGNSQYVYDQLPALNSRQNNLDANIASRFNALSGQVTAANNTANTALANANNAQVTVQAQQVTVNNYVSYVNSLKPVTYSVPVAAWTAYSQSPYSYRAAIAVSGLATRDRVDVNFSSASAFNNAVSAGVSWFTSAAANMFYMYSTAVPTSALAIKYSVYKG